MSIRIQLRRINKMPEEIRSETKAVAKAGAESGISTAVTKTNDYYISDMLAGNAKLGIDTSEAGKKCALNFLTTLFNDLGDEAVRAVPKAQIVRAMQFVSMNELDIYSGQVFIDKRWNGTRKVYDYVAQPQGDGIELMVRKFGANVKTVHPAWIIHEGDTFTTPFYDGLHAVAPTLKTTLASLDSKAIAVCYVIEMKDGGVEYQIATREGVARNVQAQILNNALKGDEKANLAKIREQIDGKTLDQLITDKDLIARGLVNPTYTSPSAREGMIIRKMKKNALLHFVRDMGARTAVFNDIDEDRDHTLDGRKVIGEADSDGTVKINGEKVAPVEVDENGEVKPEAAKPEAQTKGEGKPEAPKGEAEAEQPKEEPKAEAKRKFDPDEL